MEEQLYTRPTEARFSQDSDEFATCIRAVEAPGSGEYVDHAETVTPEELISVSRWVDRTTSQRSSIIEAVEGHYLILIAVRPVDMEISASGRSLFSGAMPSGTSYVVTPEEAALLTFRSSFDFLRLTVATRFADENGIHLRYDRTSLFRDHVIATLTQALVDHGEHPDAFKIGLTQAVAARVLGRREPHERGSPLTKWRLARFERYIAVKLHDAISLEDMAASVDLSRMHFAKSFRLATGFTPHEYLLFRRIEWAKNAMLNSKLGLCEIGLEAGFQSQAHFSTVFKRFTGMSPARWKEDNM